MSYKFRSGNGDNIALGTTAVPTTGTLSLWSKAPVYGSNGFVLFALQTDAGHLFFNQYYGPLGLLYWGWYDGTDARVVSGTPTDATWNHILMTWSPTSTKLYLNGSQTGSTVTTDGTYNTAGTAKNIGGFGGVQPADQYIAEVGLWSAILSGPDIASLYAGQRPSCFSANAVSYWPLLSDAVDSVGGDNGTATGAAVNADHPTLISCGGGGGAATGAQIQQFRNLGVY